MKLKTGILENIMDFGRTGNYIIKRNNWVGTGFEKSNYIISKRPLPPWSRKRMGRAAKSEAQNKVTNEFTRVAKETPNVCGRYSGKEKMKCYAQYRRKHLIGKKYTGGSMPRVGGLTPKGAVETYYRPGFE